MNASKTRQQRWTKNQLDLSAKREKAIRNLLEKAGHNVFMAPDAECFDGDCPRDYPAPVKCSPDYLMQIYCEDGIKSCFIEVTGSLVPIPASADLWISACKIETAMLHHSQNVPTMFVHWITDSTSGKDVVRYINTQSPAFFDFVNENTPVLVNGKQDLVYVFPPDHDSINYSNTLSDG